MRLERKKGLSGIKVHHNKTLFWVIVFLVIVLISMMVYVRIVENERTKNNQNASSKECIVDGDCIKQKIGCCSCDMGGKEVCMSIKNSSLTKDLLAKECDSRTVCTAMYACQEISCGCINGTCAKK